MIRQLEERSHEDLLKLIRVYAKNWLAHDGCWFLAAEEKYGMEAAVALDAKSWERFAVAEAKRIMKEFEIPPHGGLPALAKALSFRLYATINSQEIEWVNERKMIFRMLECRVQMTRHQKNLPDFPCKSVGLVEFSQFAKTIDPRIQTKCLACPPDPVGDFYCGWEFIIDA